MSEVDFKIDEYFFLNSRFNTYGVNTKTAILLLAQYDPRSFVSGAPVRLQQVLKDYNRNEFHHLFPRRFLKEHGRTAQEINQLANFVFMSRADNSTLGGVAPSRYRARMYEPAIGGILAHALCPESLFEDDYESFVAQRAEVLVSAARELCENGDRPTVPEVPVEPEAAALLQAAENGAEPSDNRS